LIPGRFYLPIDDRNERQFKAGALDSGFAMYAACAMMAIAAIIVSSGEIITRFVLETPAEWSEADLLSLIWMVFLAYRWPSPGAMVSVDVLKLLEPAAHPAPARLVVCLRPEPDRSSSGGAGTMPTGARCRPHGLKPEHVLGHLRCRLACWSMIGIPANLVDPSAFELNPRLLLPR
jgi:hypothetical protein